MAICRGIASETASRRASWTRNLIALYTLTYNHCGDAGLAMSEMLGNDLRLMGGMWHCDGHNHDEIAACLEESYR